jgi:hypothetical protein
VLYPESDDHLIDPKHQFLIPSLIKGDLGRLRVLLAEKQSETLLLSAEGLTNHLYDFLPEALEQFKSLTNRFSVVAFMVCREKSAWTKSYYKQAVLNPPIPNFEYATDLPYSEFCRLPRVQRLTDIDSLKAGVGAAFGTDEVVVARYEDDWVASLLSVIGIADLSATLPSVHLSISDDLIELVRQMNAQRLSTRERAGFLAAVQACFKTDHHMLQHVYRSDGDLRNVRNKEILSQLTAVTRGQAELADRLSAWLNGAD